MTRALLAAIAAAVLLAATAHAAQCGCPPTPEPPVVISPLVTPMPMPWTARVWLAWVQGGAE